MEPYAHIGVGTVPVHEDERPGLTCPECAEYMANVRNRHRQNFNDNWSNVMFAAVPGGASGPRRGGKTALESQRDWDKDLDAYRSAKQAGLQPDNTTVRGVEQAEQRAESFDRVAKKHASGEIPLSPELERSMKIGMGQDGHS